MIDKPSDREDEYFARQEFERRKKAEQKDKGFLDKMFTVFKK